MKRTLFLLSVILAAAVSGAYAQRPVLAPKSVFAAKIKTFDSLVALGKTTDAKVPLNELNQMMSEQLRNCKFKISDARAINDTAAESAGRKNLRDKYNLSNDMSKYTYNLSLNKTIIVTKLNSFMAIMD